MSCVKKLPKTIYDKANALGVTSILLQFSGGSDEGRLEVDFTHVDGTSHFDVGESSAAEWPLSDELEAFANEVYAWADKAYDYLKAGEGNDYGDDVTYYLVKRKILHHKWHFNPASKIYGQQVFEFALEIEEGE